MQPKPEDSNRRLQKAPKIVAWRPVSEMLSYAWKAARREREQVGERISVVRLRTYDRMYQYDASNVMCDQSRQETSDMALPPGHD